MLAGHEKSQVVMPGLVLGSLLKKSGDSQKFNISGGWLSCLVDPVCDVVEAVEVLAAFVLVYWFDVASFDPDVEGVAFEIGVDGADFFTCQ